MRFGLVSAAWTGGEQGLRVALSAVVVAGVVLLPAALDGARDAQSSKQAAGPGQGPQLYSVIYNEPKQYDAARDAPAIERCLNRVARPARHWSAQNAGLAVAAEADLGPDVTGGVSTAAIGGQYILVAQGHR